MKLTEWFPANIKPVRVGWYETQANKRTPVHKCYWNGTIWYWMKGFSPCFYQNRIWRGIEK